MDRLKSLEFFQLAYNVLSRLQYEDNRDRQRKETFVLYFHLKENIKFRFIF